MMVESLNTKVDLTARGISYLGIGAKYGDIMIGDRAFEFFNEKNVQDYVQIPWKDMQNVYAQVKHNQTLGRRFKIQTTAGEFDFSSKEVGPILKLIRNQLGDEHVIRQIGFWKQMGRTIRGMFQHKNKTR